MEVKRILEDIGIPKNETTIYLTLVKIGASKTGPIIKESGLHSSKVYESLERLEEKGLVSHYNEGGVKYFKAVDPKRLLDFLDEKKKKIFDQEEEIKKIIPFLSEQQLMDDETGAEIFRGWKGMETVYKMLRCGLQKGDMNYIFGASKGEDEEKTRTFFDKHVSLLGNKGVKQKIIFNEYARGNIPAYKEFSKQMQTRYMKNTTPAEINIWSDKTMIVLLTKRPVVVLISNQKVADAFRKFFDIMWISAKK